VRRLGLARLAVAALLAAALAPAGATAATDLGRPACDYCHMLLEHADYGGVITTTAGRRLIYDAIECMAAAVLTDSVPPRTIRSMTVKDYRAPHASLDAGRAVFLHSPTLESPMGLGLSAHASAARANAVRAAHPGELLDWKRVVAHVNDTWFLGKLDAAGHARLPRPRH
jgi:copper chaperone NosL